MSRDIILWNPKYPHNVGQVVRAAACFGFDRVLLTGTRVSVDPSRGYRLPREERMRGIYDVEVVATARPFDLITGTPVAVELVPGAEDMRHFGHPPDAVYVFGPEDGSLPTQALRHCHRFVEIPMLHCANLASAVYITLYDMEAKRSFLTTTPIRSDHGGHF